MAVDVQSILEMALEKGRNVLYEGKVASYIPELAKADSSNLGVCLMKKDGTIYKAGDYNIPFTMQSISKTFSLILALQTAGYDKVFSKIGMEPTGDRFDSILQLELKDWRPFNPMINAGAIVTASCVETEDPFGSFLELVRKVCNNPRISLNEEVYQSEKRTGTRNRSIAFLLKSDNVLDGEPEDILDIYFRMCSVMVTAKDLARYGMVLSNHGIDPDTGEQLIDPTIVRIVTTLMMLCGMYDESGEYAVKVGLPSKSGVGGGIVAISRKGVGIGTFGPMLNKRETPSAVKRFCRSFPGNWGFTFLTWQPSDAERAQDFRIKKMTSSFGNRSSFLFFLFVRTELAASAGDPFFKVRKPEFPLLSNFDCWNATLFTQPGTNRNHTDP